MKRSATQSSTQTVRSAKSAKVASAKNRSRVSVITRQPKGFKSGFPPQLRIRHKYVESEVALTSTTGAVATYQFSANGLFDPNITSTGHQPLYFDQCSAIYNHYTCLRSFIRVRFTHGAGAVPFVFGIAVDDDTSAASTINTAAEQSTATIIPVCGGETNANHTLTKSWDAVKYFGANPLGNDNLQGSASVNPNEQSYYTIYLKGQGVGTIGGNLTVEIWYDVVWDELTTAAAS